MKYKDFNFKKSLSSILSAYPSGFELKASRPPGCNGGVINNNNYNNLNLTKKNGNDKRKDNDI